MKINNPETTLETSVLNRKGLSFRSYPLQSSVVFNLLHPKRVYFSIFFTRNECIFQPLVDPHLKPVPSLGTFTAGGLTGGVAKLKTTLETSGEDVKNTLETSGEVVKNTSKRVEKM